MSTINPTILVVEDEPLLLQAIKKKLTVMNCKVISASNGAEGIEQLTGLGADLPDAIWLDYYLKDMNGLEFMEKIKTRPDWIKIPVFVVSNSASPEKVSTMLALGAKKYMLKAEYHLDDIINLIRRHLSGEDTSLKT